MPENSRARFRVVYSERMRRKVRALGRRAIRRGLLDVYLDLIKRIEDRLSMDPLGWGDPQHHLHSLGLLVLHRSEGPLSVNYAVDERRGIVYLRAIKPMPNKELDDLL